MHNLKLVNLDERSMDTLRNTSDFSTVGLYQFQIDHKKRVHDDIICFISKEKECSVKFYRFNKEGTETERLHIFPFSSGRSFETALAINVLDFEQNIIIISPYNLFIIPESCPYIGEESYSSIELGSESKYVTSCAYNETQDLLALVYSDDSVETITLDYQYCRKNLQGSSTLKADVPGRKNVGWGSKTTQFRGSTGKYKEAAPVEDTPIKDTVPRISWRGNGEMFAVNYWDNFKRFFKVFDPYCEPLYSVEEAPGLQPPIAWKPVGNTIACCSLLDGEFSIEMYEKNGLKHDSFPTIKLEGKIKTLHNLKWSKCSKILGAHFELEDGATLINLYSTSNFKFYLKQSLRFSAGNPAAYYEWRQPSTDSDIPLTVVTLNSVLFYNFINVIDRKIDSEHLAVINGNILQLSLHDCAYTPAPECTFKAVVNNPINSVIFHPSKTICLAITNTNETFIINYSKSGSEEISSFPIHLMEEPAICYNFHFINEILCCSTINHTTECDKVFEVAVCVYDKEYKEIQMLNDALMQQEYLSRKNSKYFSTFTRNGEVFKFSVSIDNKLYINEDCVKNHQVTSILIIENYLLAIVDHNKLAIIILKETNLEFLCSDFLNEKYCLVRPVEHGSVILSVSPETAKIVLQVPRGNFEIISCIPLAINIIENLLKENRWGEAIAFLRVNSLDPNLLIDLDYERFLNNIKEFIESCGGIHVLQIVCIELTRENFNCLKSKYKFNDSGSKELDNKCDIVLNKIIECLEEGGYSFRAETIVTLLIHKKSIVPALSYMQDLIHQIQTNPSLDDTASNCLKLFKQRYSFEQIFEEALSLYDTSLASYIISHSQLDPKYYQPLLEQLNNLQETECRFEINVLLKRYAQACRYLLFIEEKSTQDVLEFIERHQVISTAYEVCPKCSPHYEAISKKYASLLRSRGLLNEAAVVYMRSGLYFEALGQLKQLLDWRKALSVAKKAGYSREEQTDLLQELAAKLSSNNSEKEAAAIYDECFQDPGLAIKVLLDGYHFKEALHVMEKYEANDLYSLIISRLLAYKDILGNNISSCKTDFNESADRLIIVRNKLREKLQKKIDFPEEDDYLFSDTGSQSSVTSKSNRSRSSRSSRKSKKMEKLQTSLKQGGIYEDIALVRKIHCLITQISNFQNDIKTTCLLLYEHTDLEFGELKKIYDDFVDVYRLVNERVPEIWPPSFYLNNPSKDVAEVAVVQNIEFLEARYRTPPVLNLSDCVIHIFKSHNVNKSF